MPDPSGGGVKPKRPLFAAAEERDMVAWLSRCSALGLVITREMFVEEVQRIVQLEQRSITSCVGSLFGLEQWVSGFRSRHTAELGPGSLLPASKAAERELRRPPLNWYRSVSAALAKRRHTDERSPFTDPQRVLYLGEANVRLDPRTATVASLRSMPHTDKLTANDNMAYVQALSASGAMSPPMLVVPAGELVRDDLVAGDVCFRQTTSTGRVSPTALIQYLVKSLEPYLTATAVPRPVLIYVDGLQHHCSMTLTQFCDDEGIVMVGLPPGGQARNPLQQAVTSLLAANFDRVVAESRLGRRRNGKDGKLTMSLKYLLAGIRQACRRVCKETVAQAFTSSSLFPWGERVVAACEPVDGPAGPASPATASPATASPATASPATASPATASPATASPATADSCPVANGTPRRPVAAAVTENGKAAGVSHTAGGVPHTASVLSRTATVVSRTPPVVSRTPTVVSRTPTVVSRTVMVCQPDITIKREQPSPPPSPPSPPATTIDWDSNNCDKHENHGDPDDPDYRDDVSSDRDLSDAEEQADEDDPDQLVLPQARLVEYLTALDAAGDALSAKCSSQQASVVLELKDKLRALHAASSEQSSDAAEPASAAAASAAPASAPALAPAPVPAPATAPVAADSKEMPSCVVPCCDADPRRVRLYRFPVDPAMAAAWLERCSLPPFTPLTDLLAVCHLHFTAADLLPGRPLVHGRGYEPRKLRPAAVPNRKLNRKSLLATARLHVPASPSSSAEGRSSRGIKRPKRFDDFECVDDAQPLRVMAVESVASPFFAGSAPAPVAAPVPAAASPDMTELANKPPAALKSIIRILRTENAQLRHQLEVEQGRGRNLAGTLERLAQDYRAGAPP